MSYSKAREHVTKSNNLTAELAEIIAFGETRGEKSPRPFLLSKKQQWGLNHLENCLKCKEAVIELANDIKADNRLEQIEKEEGVDFLDWLDLS